MEILHTLSMQVSKQIMNKEYVPGNQSHYREVARESWEIFMEQELRFGLDLGRFGNF